MRENYYTGIPRIMEAYKDADCKPEFFVSKSYFMITLHSLNQIESHDAQNDTQKLDIINLIKIEIRKNLSITRDELDKKLLKSKATITRAIKSSYDIRFVGSSKTGHWEIIDLKKQD